MSHALRILNEVIDERERVNGKNRSALAEDLDMKIALFSKMTQGINAFGLDTLERLDRDYQIAWVKRYGAEVLGLSITELSVVDAAVAVMDAFTALQTRMRILDTVKPRMAAASLPETDSQKRSA